MLIELKKGNKIYIKPKNRGKFTKYCHGKVTDECIKKAKASGNPTLVKRATFAQNARHFKHKSGGILKAQLGTNLDVDNRSDTTRKGYGSIPYFGAANSSNTAGLWDLMNYNVTGNPNIITGEPVILPGRVNMSLYKDAKYLLKGPQYDEGFVNFVDRLAKGKIKPSQIGTYKEPVTKFVNLESESIPKGYVKGNEVTPDLRYPISEEGLTIRNIKPIKLENPITNEAEAAAARDWLKENKRRKFFKKGGKAFVNEVSVLDSNPNAYKQVKKKVKMRQRGGDITINSSPDIMKYYYWKDFVQEYAERKRQEKAYQDATEAQLKAQQTNTITNGLTNLTEMLIEGIGNKKKSSNAAPSTTTGTSSTLTNIGNTGMLSSSQNPMNFFGINN